MHLEDYDQLHQRLWRGHITTAAQWQQAFVDLLASREAMAADLRRLTLPQLRKRYDGFYVARTKAEAVERAWSTMVRSFALDSFEWAALSETPEAAVQRALDALTDESLRAAVARHNAAMAGSPAQPTCAEYHTAAQRQAEAPAPAAETAREHPASAQAAPAPDQRKPWQMTQAEFLGPVGKMPHDWRMLGWKIENHSGFQQAIAPDGTPYTLGKSSDGTGEVTLYRSDNFRYHEGLVERALTGGENVPQVVLADYPRLAAIAAALAAGTPIPVEDLAYYPHIEARLRLGAPPRDRWLHGEAEPWQLTQREMLASDIVHMRYGAHVSGVGDTPSEARARLRREQEKVIRGHRADVARALADSKPVPAEVLADYPNLAPTPGKETPVQESAPLTPADVKVGEVLACDAVRCVVVECELGGYVSVCALDQEHYTPLAPADLALFRKTGKIELRPAVRRYLRQHEEVHLADMQDKFGYSRAMGNTPTTNPLNAAVKLLADAGEITIEADGWGLASNPRLRLASPASEPEASPSAFADPQRPLGAVATEDETRYYGTRVTVLSHGERLVTWVARVCNRGTLLEIHNPHCPGDPQATFRISGDQVISVDELIDRRLNPTAPLPIEPVAPDVGADLAELDLGGLYRDYVGRERSISVSPSQATLRQYAIWARNILHGRDPVTAAADFARFIRVRLAGAAQDFDLDACYEAFANGKDFTPDEVRTVRIERAQVDTGAQHEASRLLQTPSMMPLAALEAKIAEWGDGDDDARRAIWQTLSGDSQRKTRQALMQALTGQKLPMAKCGVSALEQAYLAWRAAGRPAAAQAAPPTPEPAAPVGPARSMAGLTQLALF